MQSDDAELNRRLAVALRDAVATWDETRWVTAHRDLQTILQHRLLYLPTERLETLAAQVETRIAWEECEAQPGCLSLEDRPELPTRASLQADLEATPAGQLVAAFAPGAAGQDAASADEGGGMAREGRVPLCSSDGRTCMVEAGLNLTASSLSQAEQILERSRALFAEVRPTDAPPSLRMEVAGRFRNAPLTKAAAQQDVRLTGFLSGALLLLLVLLRFRSVRALVLLGAPLVVAIAITLGVLSWVHPQLNLISAFTFAILAGIGIDFGLHLVMHYDEVRREAVQPMQAAQRVLSELSGSLLVAGATTALAFGALSVASFRGFGQMGAMTALGVGISLLSYALLFPPLVVLLERARAESGPMVRRWTLGGRLGRVMSRRRSSDRIGAQVPFGAMSVVVVLGVLSAAGLGALGAGWGAGDGVAFEYDFRRLRPASVENHIARGDAGGTIGGTAVALMAESPAALAALDVAGLEGAGVEGLRLVRPGDLIPGGLEDEEAVAIEPAITSPNTTHPETAERTATSSTQGVRLALLARMARALARVEGRTDDPRIDAFSALLVDTPLTAEDLPPWLAELFVERDGTFGRTGLLYVDARGSDAHAMESLTSAMDHWRARYPQVEFASPSAVLGEVVPSLRRDGPWILGLALLGLVVAVFLMSRDLRRVALVLAPVLLAMSATAGSMSLLGLRLDLYNMLVVPVAFGIGVDGAVYMAWAGLASNGKAKGARAARAVATSTLTTMAAFGSLVFASNPGLVSIGQLALLSLSWTLLANLVWMPALLRMMAGFRKDASTGKADMRPGESPASSEPSSPDSPSPEPMPRPATTSPTPSMPAALRRSVPSPRRVP